jgi:hypothetical protein
MRAAFAGLGLDGGGDHSNPRQALSGIRARYLAQSLKRDDDCGQATASVPRQAATWNRDAIADRISAALRRGRYRPALDYAGLDNTL